MKKKKALPEHDPEDDLISAGGLEGVGDLLSGAEPDLETGKNVDHPRIHIRRPLRRSHLAAKQEELEAFFTRLPAAGESLHIVSNGTFDYWCFVPVTLRLLGRAAGLPGHGGKREFHGESAPRADRVFKRLGPLRLPPKVDGEYARER